MHILPLRCGLRAAAALLAIALLPLGGCNTVEFYEMEAFSDPVMGVSASPARVHLDQKVLYSMEGSAGGVGGSAGGGCGCY